MRWIPKDKPGPYYGDKRIVKRFAISPIETRNDHEYRWMEIVYIKQTYERGYIIEGWRNICFGTKDDYLNFKLNGKKSN